MSALPGKYLDLIRDGAPPDELRAAVWSTLLAAVRCGWTFGDWHREMTSPTNRLGEWYWRRDDTGKVRSDDSVRSKIRSEYDRAAEHAATNPAVTDAEFAREYLREHIAAADAYDWSARDRRDRTGIRDREVLAALHRIAYQRGTLTPTVSIRTLCEATPFLGRTTMQRALASLIERRWLSRAAHATAEHPAAYRLQGPRVVRSGTVDDLPAGGDAVPLRTDPLLGLAVGPYGAAVYAALGDLPQSARGVSRRAQVSHQTAGRHLWRLERDGLAVIDHNGDWIRGPVDPGEVARGFQARKRARDRALRHELERRGWAAYVVHTGTALPSAEGTAVVPLRTAAIAKHGLVEMQLPPQSAPRIPPRTRWISPEDLIAPSEGPSPPDRRVV